MKFALAALFHAALGLALGAGIVLAAHGAPTLLVLSTLLYLGLLVRFGCLGR